MKNLLTHKDPAIRKFAKQVLNGAIHISSETALTQGVIEKSMIFQKTCSIERSKIKDGVIVFLQDVNIYNCEIEGAAFLLAAKDITIKYSIVKAPVGRKTWLEVGTDLVSEIIENIKKIKKL